MTRNTPPLPAFRPDNIVVWATDIFHWYELYFNRIKNLQVNYIDKTEAKFAAFYPSYQDLTLRWNLFMESPWWQRFHKLYQKLMLEYDQFVKICLDVGIPLSPFHPLRSGSIVPQQMGDRLGYTTIEHQYSRAPDPEIFRQILASYFQI